MRTSSAPILNRHSFIRWKGSNPLFLRAISDRSATNLPITAISIKPNPGQTVRSLNDRKITDGGTTSGSLFMYLIVLNTVKDQEGASHSPACAVRTQNDHL